MLGRITDGFEERPLVERSARHATCVLNVGCGHTGGGSCSGYVRHWSALRNALQIDEAFKAEFDG